MWRLLEDADVAVVAVPEPCRRSEEDPAVEVEHVRERPEKEPAD